MLKKITTPITISDKETKLVEISINTDHIKKIVENYGMSIIFFMDGTSVQTKENPNALSDRLNDRMNDDSVSKLHNLQAKLNKLEYAISEFKDLVVEQRKSFQITIIQCLESLGKEFKLKNNKKKSSKKRTKQ